MRWLTAAIKEGQPDLIVLGGDQLLGRDKTFDTISTLTKMGHFFAGHKVPWTVVFGNHDTDRSLAIEEQMYLLKHMPFFVGKAGPGVPGFPEEDLPPADYLSDMGVGNYVLRVNASLSDPTQLLSLYFLDSHVSPIFSSLEAVITLKPISYRIIRVARCHRSGRWQWAARRSTTG